MKKLSAYIWENKLRYILAIGSMILAVSLDLMSPQLTKHIIDDVIVGGQIGKLKYLLAGILAIGVGTPSASMVSEMVMGSAVS